jgi:hypothetical protein
MIDEFDLDRWASDFCREYSASPVAVSSAVGEIREHHPELSNRDIAGVISAMATHPDETIRNDALRQLKSEIAKQIVIDYVILTCNGCQTERTFQFNPPLRGADEIDHWLKTGVGSCDCGAPNCTAKMHMLDEQ